LGLLIVALLFSLWKILEGEKKGQKVFIHLPYLLFLLLYLTKETAVIFLPFSIALYFSAKHFYSIKKSLPELKRVLIFNLVLSAIIVPVVLVFKQGGEYSTYYELSMQGLYRNFRDYLKSIHLSLYPYFFVFLGAFAIRNIHKFLNEDKIVNKRFFWQAISFLLFSLLLLIQLPWEFPLNRYLLPSLVPLSVFLGLEFHNLSNYLISKTRVEIPLLFFAFFLPFAYNNAFHFFNYFQSTSNATQATKKALEYIREVSPPRTEVWVNAKESDATIEPVLEAGYHLEHFYKRPDIKVGYVGELGGENLEEKTIILSSFVSEDGRSYTDKELEDLETFSLGTIIQFDIKTFHPLPINRVLSELMNLNFARLKTSAFRLDTKKEEWRIYKNF